MKIKLKLENVDFFPNSFYFTFISEKMLRVIEINNKTWMFIDINSNYCSYKVTENIRTILKDSPARIWEFEQTNSKN